MNSSFNIVSTSNSSFNVSSVSNIKGINAILYPKGIGCKTEEYVNFKSFSEMYPISCGPIVANKGSLNIYEVIEYLNEIELFNNNQLHY